MTPRRRRWSAALFTSAGGGTHSGIIEDVVQDRRLSATEARARGQAYLAERRDVTIRVRYRSRDLNTRSGRLVTIYLPADPHNLSATFMIQSVRIHDFTPALAPQLRRRSVVDAVLVRGFVAADQHEGGSAGRLTSDGDYPHGDGR